jgi:hypothetical protein
MCQIRSVGERYEIDTVVRRPFSRSAVTLGFFAFIVVAGFLPEIARTACIVGAALATSWALRAGGTIRRARVVASSDGLRVGRRLVPRRSFRHALLQHDRNRTFVALRGRSRVDVQVPSNVEADALVRALGLDAASSTVELTLGRSPSSKDVLAMVGIGVLTLVAFAVSPTVASRFISAACGVLVLLGFAWLATRVSLRVGADGLLLRPALGRERFLAHDAIALVRADDAAIVIEPKAGAALTLRVPGITAGTGEQPAQDERRADEAAAIVRRILQAWRAFGEHRTDPSTLAAVLARRDRSTLEWLDALRRTGEGAVATFRAAGAPRAQLLAVVESTTASARDRVAALVALRARLTADETPRVRVAAERCAQPELRNALIRVVDSDADDVMTEALEETERAG